MNKNLRAEAAVQGMLLAIGSGALHNDAKRINEGSARMYTKEEMIIVLSSAAQLLDKAAETILAMLDDAHPEVAEKRKEINDLNRLLDL